jgi:cytochrome b6-f complex iron-sulfur subunit
MCAEQVSQPKPTRRHFMEIFLGGGLLATLASFLYPVMRYLIPPTVTDLGGGDVVAAKVGDLKPNSGEVFKFGDAPGLLILANDNTYHAVSATCTHLGCTVQYRADLQQIWCPCHNGHFDINGRNVSGPPPRPLEAFDVHVRGSEIVVSRKKEA